MIPTVVSYASGYTIVFAVLIALMRFKKIHRSYKPFVYIVFLTLIHETIGPLLIENGYSNAISVNIFAYLESLLWLWQFKRWGDFQKQPWVLPLLITLSTAIALTETVILWSADAFNSIHSIFFAFYIVFLAINQVNLLIVEEKKSLITNSKFLICTGIIIFYTYRIMTETFYVLELQQSNTFWRNIHAILLFVNVFVNLIFAVATLWIPTRQRFLMPSS